MTSNEPEATAGRFRAVDALPAPVFAVLDGGHFDDLEDELAEAGISSRSLFLKGGDDEMRREGRGWSLSKTTTLGRISKSSRSKKHPGATSQPGPK